MPEAAEAVVETEAPAPDGQEPEAQSEPVEDKARRAGWRPKDEFAGPDDKWVDAETFVKRGEEDGPIARSTIRQFEKALAKSQREVAEVKDVLKEYKAFYSKAIQKQYNLAIKDLEARQVQATEDGDVAGVQAITREITDLHKDIAEPAEAETAPDKDAVQAVEAFKRDNPWYGKDAALTGAIHAIAAELHAEGMTDPEKQIAEASKRLRAEFPDKFDNPRRKEAAAVEGAGGAPRKNGKSGADLPADAKVQADRFIKQGLFKTRDEYAKEFFA